MAKKGQKVILENVELQPQVIGLTYKKKSNLGRVVFVFIAFALVVYYINDISVFINDLLGRQTADTIREPSRVDEEEKESPTPDGELTGNEELTYYSFSNSLTIEKDSLTLNNFNMVNNQLTFVVSNKTKNPLNLSNKKYFLETYDTNKTLLERFKVDVGNLVAEGKIDFALDVTNNNVQYLTFIEKSVDDYPEVDLKDGVASLTCEKANENITYTFNNLKLSNIVHTIMDNDKGNAAYYSRLNLYQTKVNSYNNIDGITASININDLGYTVNFNIDLKTANVSNLEEKYYFKNEEEAKVVSFEMQTYGFKCQ